MIGEIMHAHCIWMCLFLLYTWGVEGFTGIYEMTFYYGSPSFCGHGCITWHGVGFIVMRIIQMNPEVLCLPNFFRSNILSRFSRPILHGLCTLGFAVRAIIKCLCRGDPNLIKNISARFLLHVYPGETLITEMWLEGLR